MFGGRVKVVGAWVVLVGGGKLDGVLHVAVEDQALVLQVVELESNLIKFQMFFFTFRQPVSSAKLGLTKMI